MAADVCAALDIANVGNATARLDDDEKGIRTVDTLGGAQQLSAVNESGLYALILGSRKPEARRFKKWMTAEMLPANRTKHRWTTRWARTAGGALLQVPARLVDPVRALHLMNSEALPSPRRGFLVGSNGPPAAHKTSAPGHRK